MCCRTQKLRIFTLVLVAGSLLSVLAAPRDAFPVPLNQSPPCDARTYSFTARITDNGGVTSLKVGETIRGTLAYDLKGKDRHPDIDWCGHFESPRNALSFQIGDQCFSSTGTTLATMSVSEHQEHVGVVTYALRLPKGWEMGRGLSQSVGVCFQNAPPRGVLPRKGLPDRLRLADWVNTRELRLDFCHGVRFPSGSVEGRATVIATIEELQELREGR
jgi:hypothetical protein